MPIWPVFFGVTLAHSFTCAHYASPLRSNIKSLRLLSAELSLLLQPSQMRAGLRLDGEHDAGAGIAEAIVAN
jgi:hypothetical protein